MWSLIEPFMLLAAVILIPVLIVFRKPMHDRLKRDAERRDELLIEAYRKMQWQSMKIRKHANQTPTPGDEQL